MATILIGSARHDENGGITGGKAGDQKQKISSDGLDHAGEVSVQPFYVHKKGWVIYRAKDINLAKGIAFCMAVACNNKNIGYNQLKRLEVYLYGILADKPINADCSELIRAIIKQCGYDLPDFTTASAGYVLLASNLFDKVAYTDTNSLCNGDILCTKTKGHIVAVISGARSRDTKEENPFKEPTKVVKKGANGESVKWVQWELKQWGASLKVDGAFGDITDRAVRAFQTAFGLDVDGEVGKVTRGKMKEV